jgi:aryl-alcohol dehydrogenase-like predicted oxidoreductase
MQSRRLGKSAIHVSDICMGTMTFGSQTDEAEAFRILDRCFDEGINFYDTAEGYPVPPDIKWVGRTRSSSPPKYRGRAMSGSSRHAAAA